MADRACLGPPRTGRRREEARELTATDPAIRRGWLEMELHPWYGPAAMRALYDINQRIQREEI